MCWDVLGVWAVLRGRKAPEEEELLLYPTCPQPEPARRAGAGSLREPLRPAPAAAEGRFIGTRSGAACPGGGGARKDLHLLRHKFTLWLDFCLNVYFS